MAERNPGIAYAENILAVHLVYEEAKEAERNLQAAQGALRIARSTKARLLEKIADREAGIIAAERDANPEMSQTSMDKHLKSVFRSDSEHGKIRTDILDASDVIDLHEGNVRLYEVTIRIRVARLGELGGYLEFLSALKRDETSRAYTYRPPPGSPW